MLLVPPRLGPDHPLRSVLTEFAPATVTSTAGLMSLAAHALVPAAVRRARADLYHHPHFNLPLLSPGRTVVTVHDLNPLIHPAYFASGAIYKRAYFRAATAFSIRRSSAVITPSRHVAERIHAEFRPRTRVVAIPEGVDAPLRVRATETEVAAFRARFGLAAPYLFYVGVQRPHKNLARVVEAFSRVAARQPHDLVLAGQRGPWGEEPAASLDPAIGRRVRQLGYLSEDDLRAAYAGADAFVYCSLEEGFGLPVLEAMRSGVPVITSSVGATAEVAGDAALLVDPRSVDAIAAALARVCERADVRDDLRRRGTDRVAAFTWERAARETLGVYRSVL